LRIWVLVSEVATDLDVLVRVGVGIVLIRVRVRVRIVLVRVRVRIVLVGIRIVLVRVRIRVIGILIHMAWVEIWVRVIHMAWPKTVRIVKSAWVIDIAWINMRYCRLNHWIIGEAMHLVNLLQRNLIPIGHLQEIRIKLKPRGLHPKGLLNLGIHHIGIDGDRVRPKQTHHQLSEFIKSEQAEELGGVDDAVDVGHELGHFGGVAAGLCDHSGVVSEGVGVANESTAGVEVFEVVDNLFGE
jgi:hypothetical protein